MYLTGRNFIQRRLQDIPPTDLERFLRSSLLAYNKECQVFKNFNCTLQNGKIYHLKGRNGAGKTTLAKLLTGILRPTEGEILANGRVLNAYRYPGATVGYSFQSPDEQLFSSAVEYEILGRQKNETETYTATRKYFLDIFGLQSVRKCHPADLPFVMRKRISIASVFAKAKPWYILDEPSLGQDSHFLDVFAKLVEHLTDEGKGIIIISHSSELIKKINCEELPLE